ncbi:type IX secretion system protein PorQ [Porifericola rhodea]|uniref:type IX secretion system protein PorQ n=1 Tax=Porifericola rhodea TaxID=930972 RepID=UPI00266625EB|nr:type IX secretion system protein PorQ [Porifericola rhodea]WKN31652.1 type IX secretion system protein PorQ [Porifericola rhodea]
MRYFLTCILFFFFEQSLLAQLAKPYAFDFLNLSASARQTALGGVLSTVSIDSSAADTYVWLSNPATNHTGLHQKLSLSYQPYYADIHASSLTYSRTIGKGGSWGVGIKYVSYGEMDSYDLTGYPFGSFSSQEYAISFNRSHQSGPFRIGLNAKWIASDLANYHASAILFDVGGMFIHPEHDFTLGLSLNNVGLLLNDYTSFTQSRMPSDLRLSAAFKPTYMPFRFYVSAYQLINHYEAYYQQDNNEKPGYVNKILRHMSFGGELLLSKNFQVQVGYNSLKRSTLQLEQLSGGAGLSFGFTLRLRFLQLDYARAFYHVAGGFNHFTLNMNLDRLNFKRN